LFILNVAWYCVYLEQHFNGENSSEDVIEVSQNVIPLAVLLNWVLRRQGDAAQDDDDHDEGLETGNSHDSVNQDSNSVAKKFSLKDKLLFWLPFS
jgi:hypothetical protein